MAKHIIYYTYRGKQHKLIPCEEFRFPRETDFSFLKRIIDKDIPKRSSDIYIREVYLDSVQYQVNNIKVKQGGLNEQSNLSEGEF